MQPANRTLAGLAFLALAATSERAAADPVLYEVQSDYSAGGFSASWMHGATGCEGLGPDSEDTLYMCGDPLLSISGHIEGDLEAGVLTITGGMLNVGGTDYAVDEGELGAFGSGNVWGINIGYFGDFLFENILMGSGKPNYFDGDTMILWGQNLAAYTSDPGTRDRWGMDLYATRVSVPEPGTLALLSLGLLGLGAARRRKSATATANG